MHVIWQGRGPIALVALIIPMALMTIGLLVFSHLEDISPLMKVLWVGAPLVLGCLIAGGICHRWGRRLNKDQNLHTLYYIPLQHWAFIYWGIALGGIILVVIGLIRSSQP